MLPYYILGRRLVYTSLLYIGLTASASLILYIYIYNESSAGICYLLYIYISSRIVLYSGSTADIFNNTIRRVVGWYTYNYTGSLSCIFCVWNSPSTLTFYPYPFPHSFLPSPEFSRSCCIDIYFIPNL